MTTPTTQQELIRTLDAIRQRLQLASNTLAKTRLDLEHNDPLPPWPSLLNSLQLAQSNLATLHNLYTSQHQPALQAAHVYPLPAFPGRTQEDLLAQLLRKKVQPGVEDWIADGQKRAASVPGIVLPDTAVTPDDESDASEKHINELEIKQLEELWDSAFTAAVDTSNLGEAWDSLFTLAEEEAGVESVVTGLRRKLWDSDDESDEESHDKDKSKDKMHVDQTKEPEFTTVVNRATMIMRARKIDANRQPLPLEAVLRYSLTGALPPEPFRAQR